MSAMAKLMSIALVLVGVVQAASAQFNMAGPDGKMMVVITPEAQKELKITKDQNKQIQEVMKEAQAQGQTGMSGMSGMASPTQMLSELDAKVLAILSPEQVARLNELWVQYEGPCVLRDKAIAEKLNLTDDQKAKLEQIWSDYQRTFFEQAQKGPGGFKGLKKVRSDANEAALALLTDDQKTAYEALQGKPIKWRAKKEI